MIKRTLSPVVLFVYNKPETTKNCLQLLEKNYLADETDLIIYSDGPKDLTQKKNVNNVREIISKNYKFKNISIHLSDKNKGLGNSVIEGVTEIIEKYGKVIVLEDDLLTSPFFLEFMNLSLDYFEDNMKIWSISGYTPKVDFPEDYRDEIYATLRACSWGWGTWANRWEKNAWKIESDPFLESSTLDKRTFNKSGNDMYPMLKNQLKGEIDSWAIRWCFNQYVNNQLTVYPRYSYVSNIGLNEVGATHGSLSRSHFQSEMADGILEFKKEVTLDERIIKSFAKNYNLKLYNYLGILARRMGIYHKLKKLR